MLVHEHTALNWFSRDEIWEQKLGGPWAINLSLFSWTEMKILSFLFKFVLGYFYYVALFPKQGYREPLGTFEHQVVFISDFPLKYFLFSYQKKKFLNFFLALDSLKERLSYPYSSIMG